MTTISVIIIIDNRLNARHTSRNYYQAQLNLRGRTKEKCVWEIPNFIIDHLILSNQSTHFRLLSPINFRKHTHTNASIFWWAETLRAVIYFINTFHRTHASCFLFTPFPLHKLIITSKAKKKIISNFCCKQFKNPFIQLKRT